MIGRRDGCQLVSPTRFIERHRVAAVGIRLKRQVVNPQVGQLAFVVFYAHLRALARRINGQQGAVAVALRRRVILEGQLLGGRCHGAFIGVDRRTIGAPVVVVAVPLIVALFCIALDLQPFAQIVQPAGLDGQVAVRFDKARPVLNQVIAVKRQAVAAVEQGAIPVAQALAGLQRQAVGRCDDRRLAVVVESTRAHGNIVAHQRRGVVQGIDVHRHGVRFNAPAVLQGPGRQLKCLAHQDRRIGDAGRIEDEFAR
ncbi:Uncharacterised protein [Klebsiella pneumoniae]|nr:Uncharacterised protein [Klebsiella pneumoniae]